MPRAHALCGDVIQVELQVLVSLSAIRHHRDDTKSESTSEARRTGGRGSVVLGAPQIRCTRLNSSGHENSDAFSFSFLASLSSLRPGGRSPGPAAIAARRGSEWFVFFCRPL